MTEIKFSKPITILVGENGSGKSTLLEFIAYACGFNILGGSKNHLYKTNELESLEHLKQLSQALKLAWLPKISNGFFMRAETFFNFIEHSLDGPDNISQFYGGNLLEQSHGEGFLTFFEHTLNRQGLFLFDEPEAALSPSRQIEFLKILKQAEAGGKAQIIIITHSPLLMAYPNADLLLLNHRGIWPSELEQIEHFKMMARFYRNPHGFMEEIWEKNCC